MVDEEMAWLVVVDAEEAWLVVSASLAAWVVLSIYDTTSFIFYYIFKTNLHIILFYLFRYL